jgi:tetratricopeptide (TPR) repeat protein
VFGVGIGWYAYVNLPLEIARWYVAAAALDQFEGQTAQARQRLQRSLEWHPHNAPALLCRAKLRLSAGDHAGALEDFRRVCRLRPRDLRALFGQVTALQRLGRGDEAVQAIERRIRDWPEATEWERVVCWNAAAYARAVAALGLEQALQQADKAIQVERRLANQANSAELLDTRGFILYRLNRLDAALADLDRAALAIENRLVYQQSERNYIDAFEREEEIRQVRESAAVIHYHRALVREAVGRRDAAKLDLRRVRQLGYVPDENLF